MKKLIVFTNFENGLDKLLQRTPLHDSDQLKGKGIMSLKGNCLISEYNLKDDAIFLLSDEIGKDTFDDFIKELSPKEDEIYILWHQNDHNGNRFKQESMFENVPSSIICQKGQHIDGGGYDVLVRSIQRKQVDLKNKKWAPDTSPYSPDQVNDIIDAIFIDEANKKLEDNLYTLHKELEDIYNDKKLSNKERTDALQELAKKRDDLFNEGISKK